MPGPIQCFMHLFIGYTNSNSCNTGTYSVMYALIYWLFMLCLPLFLGDSSYSSNCPRVAQLLSTPEVVAEWQPPRWPRPIQQSSRWRVSPITLTSRVATWTSVSFFSIFCLANKTFDILSSLEWRCQECWLGYISLLVNGHLGSHMTIFVITIH